MIEIKVDGKKKTFDSLTDFLKYTHRTVQSLKYNFTKDDDKKEISEKDIPGYLKHSSEQFVITYTIECLLQIERVIKNISVAPTSTIYDHDVNTAFNIIVKERNKLLGLLEQSIGFIDIDKKLIGIRDGILEERRKLKNANAYKKDDNIKDAIGKIAIENINDSFDRLDELEKTIDEVSELIDDASPLNNVIFSVKSELSKVVGVVSPSVLLLIRSKKDELLETEKKFLELDYMYDSAHNNFDIYSYNRVKKNSKDTPKEERRAFVALKDSFRNLRQAGRHLNKYRLKIDKIQQKEETKVSDDIKVAQSVLSLSSTVIHDLNESGEIIKDNEEKIKRFKSSFEQKSIVPEYHQHTYDRLDEVKDLMEKGRSR